MSGAYGNNTFSSQPPPSHHIHRDSEVLPGTQGAEYPPAPYDTETTTNPETWKSNNERQFGAGTDTGNVMAGGQHSTAATGTGSSLGDADPSFRHGGTGTPPTSTGHASAKNDTHDAFHEDRPLGVKHTHEGKSHCILIRSTVTLTGFLLPGGVAIGGKDDLPEGHATLMDKMIGKTQKVCSLLLLSPQSVADDTYRSPARP